MKSWISIFRSRIAAFVHDLAMIPAAWLGAYWLRFNLEQIPPVFWREALLLTPLVMATQGAMFWYFGLYRGVWRFASVPDLMRIMKAIVVGLLISAAIVFVVNRLVHVPRSVFFLEGILLLLFLGGPRFAYRWLKDRHLYSVDRKRALIVGAGRAGEMLIRDMLRDASSPYRPVVLVDDDRRKVGKEIHGLPVAGVCDQISELADERLIDLIIIALPSATTRQVRRVVEICERTSVPFRTIPRLQDLVSGRASIKDLRDVSIEDLLGREPVELDWAAIEHGTRGLSVLVTGGGGSIGAELCRQIARLSPARLVIFERNEYSLYSIEQELRENCPALECAGVLGDVCDATAVEGVFLAYAPHVVYHAAAYKHVPMLEAQSRSAVVNNVMGTRVVATAADRHDCHSFVLISTDKAVNPANIMGATKRVAEIVCQDLSQRSKTRFTTVRFGNVLGSSGSVVPLFQQQIARGGPVTVTHPAVTRYFMTIPEACQLILQASVIGQGGEIFVLDMGEAIKISYLAEQLIRLSGKRPGVDIEIRFTGLRAGEKLCEELFHHEEQLGKTAHPKILLANCRPAEGGLLLAGIEDLEQACRCADESRVKRVLESLVPERSTVAIEELAPPLEFRRVGGS